MRVPRIAVRRLIPVVVVLAASTWAVATPAAATDGGRPLSAALTGSVEVPPGDPGGSGTAEFRVNVGQGQICFSLSVQHLSAPVIAAHIHVAPAGQAGPIVVPLAAPVTGTSSGCADVERALAKDILQHPEAYYVNVHTTAFPAGAVRGQLHE
jgi:CHRD domain-containing protein